MIATIVGGFALLVLVGGWLLDIRVLRTILPSWTPMAPLTTVLLMLTAAGVLLFDRRPKLANVILLISAALAFAVLLHYLFDVDLGLWRATRLIGHGSTATALELPAPDTSAAFVLIVLSLACFRTRIPHLHDFGDVVASLIGVICIQVLISYAYSIVYSASHLGFRQIAPHSTLAMTLLAFAAVARRPTPGLFAAMNGPEQSALLLRRLLPITLVLCLLMGWLQLLGMRENVVGTIPELVAWTVTGALVVLAVVLFVTSAEMRKAETAVRQRQEQLVATTAAAEAASETKSRFMAVMSHELRTPLTAMIGYADLLEAGAAGELPPEARRFMERIRTSGWHLVGLIDSVLFYAGGKPPVEDMEKAEFDVVAVVREVVALFEPQVRDKGLAISVDAPAQAVRVTTMRRQLQQVLMHLLSNAVKFTEHGKIEVDVRVVGNAAVIEVMDTGLGISAEHLHRIWEPFQQVDASHTRVQGGMGLGLALTRRLVDQLGAHVTVKSEVDKGTTFIIELPTGASAPRNEVTLAGARVLVVDDELAVRRIMARTLSRYGAQVSEAESAHEALIKIGENGGFDVAVTDVSMPGMTGIELAQTLRSRDFALPILFVTGAELDERDNNNIERLGGRLLRKPFDMVELVRHVDALIVRNRSLPGSPSDPS